MQRISAARLVSQVFLWIVPFLPIPFLLYQPGDFKLFAFACAVRIFLMGIAVWFLAADSIRNSTGDRRTLLLAGVLLIACLASAAIAASMGPPPRLAAWATTRADEHMRYVALLVAGLLAWAGLALLTSTIHQAGERIFSILGLSTATISTVVFIQFTLTMLTVVDLAATQMGNSGKAPEWWFAFSALIGGWLVLCAVLGYLAAALYAVALAKVGLLGKGGRTAFVLLGVVAAALSLLTVATPNQQGGLTHGLFVFLIPAVPFILPYYIGVHLVRRAGDVTSSSS